MPAKPAAMNKAVSDYMRQMQRSSAESRWRGKSAAEKKKAMADLARRRWGKAKPANDPDQWPGENNQKHL